MAHYAIKVELDGLGVFDGYTDGETWNGFEAPEFERDEAEYVLDQMVGEDWESWTYDEETDTFYVTSRYDDELYEFEGYEITVTGGIDKRVYAIGAYMIAWLKADVTA